MDIEAALLTWLSDLGSTFTVTPNDLQQRLPAIRIAKVGGPRDQIEDHPILDIQTYTLKDASNPRASLDLANAVCARILAFPFMAGTVLVDEAVCSTGPVGITYPDPTLSVFRAIYGLTIRL